MIRLMVNSCYLWNEHWTLTFLLIVNYAKVEISVHKNSTLLISKTHAKTKYLIKQGQNKFLGKKYNLNIVWR